MKSDSFNKITEKGNIKKSVRESINSGLFILSRVRDDLPFELIDEFLRSNGLRIVNEDGTDYEAIFTGTEGRVAINVAETNGNIVNNKIIASWHLYPNSNGKYDFNCYLS